ncbi:MAG: hypothetical protein ACK55I_45810, partial [bacterium]
NKEKLNRYYKKHRKKRNEQSIQWANNNKEYKSEQHKKWREKNKNRHNTNYIEWKKKNREYLKTYRKKRRQNNTNLKLIDNVRRRINTAIKNKTKHSIEYLGIDIASYKEYLENLFQQGMNWNN